MPRFIRIPLIVLAVLAAGYVVFRGSTRQQAGQIADCKVRYAGARTRADTLIVDAWRLPSAVGTGGRLSTTCGYYRSSRRL